MKGYMLLLVVVGLAFASYSNAAVIGTSSIRAPAVLLNNNTGSLTNISLVITNGDGTVKMVGPQTVGQSTTQSAQTAAAYASMYTNHKFNDYNFTYTISNAGNNVSGPSAGAAMTMLAISAFENRPLRTNFTMTGTISSNGSIGEIGGVYDKISAAKAAGIKLALVPKVAADNQEDELYLLVQTNFGMPLVQVANISQAAYFAFNSNINGNANKTTYDFYTNYYVGALPNASISCTELCNETIFGKLLNDTFKLTRNEINSLNNNPKFSNISSQLGIVLNQSVEISEHGYIYTAADLSFLDYVNAFYFNGYPSNRSSALDLLEGVQNFCNTLTPPPLTEQNFDYVINAELRQTWGTYTINATISSYNTSQIESDEILDELYLGAQSVGWCNAANLVYNESNVSGTYVAPSVALKALAQSRITRAAPYGNNLYFATAQQAYSIGNYPLAILDADYAYALSYAGINSSSMSTPSLLAASKSDSANSTYGVWATEFAKESQFYSYESSIANNSTQANGYAITAYSSALLAQQISNDTMNINNNLIVTQQPQYPQTGIATGSSPQSAESYVMMSQEAVLALLVIVIILLVINMIMMLMVMKSINANKSKRRKK
ncbi:MAG: S16 family serine protease [Candidatus Micrarchaeaceae archaeon]